MGLKIKHHESVTPYGQTMKIYGTSTDLLPILLTKISSYIIKIRFINKIQKI